MKYKPNPFKSVTEMVNTLAANLKLEPNGDKTRFKVMDDNVRAMDTLMGLRDMTLNITINGLIGRIQERHGLQ